MIKENVVIKKNISRKVYEENGINIYEKIFRPNDIPFWGITPKVIEMLKREKSPYVVKFVWEGHGGIILSPEEMDIMLLNRKIAKNGDYKINKCDFEKYKINANWEYSITNKL